MVYKIFMIGFGGFLGAISRFLLSKIAHLFLGNKFFYGTLAVNVIGCFIMGFFIIFATEKGMLSEYLRSMVIIGFLGAFTTFSAFSYETYSLIGQDNYLAFMNIITNVLFCIMATAFGIIVARGVL